MRRRRFRKQALTLSLFPFLAVLVCTMGALIVLLVMVVQKARVDADTSSEQHAQLESLRSAEQETLRESREVHEWRRQVLEKQRAELRDKQGDHRLHLSHLEDHIRRLEERWRELGRQAQQLEQLGQSRERDLAAAHGELERARTDMEAARIALRDAQAQAAARMRTFAIVPYDGPHGTKRRPIYIECTDEGVVLQPEGIVLRAQDFEGSLGPGNPLDAALRATREYLTRLGDSRIHGEPYPLLIVRPSGTVAYAVARAAIRSWDDEFGYELVDAEMRLAFPPPNAVLRRELERAISDARSRQAMLAVAMPGRYGRNTASGLVATTSGGFRPVGAAREGLGGGTVMAGGDSNFSSVFRQAGSTSASTLPRTGNDSLPGTATGQLAGATSPHANNNAKDGSSAMPGGGTGIANAASAAGSPSGANSQGAGASAAAGADGTSPSTSGSQPAAGSDGTMRHLDLTRKAPADVQPLAASRGENWGLPNHSRSATGFTRYIAVLCLADRLVVLPEPGDHRGQLVIPAARDLTAALDLLVSAVWSRMNSWGIAAENGYWKPVLRVSVGPGAEMRFEELRALLDRSGLIVERK